MFLRSLALWLDANGDGDQTTDGQGKRTSERVTKGTCKSSDTVIRYTYPIIALLRFTYHINKPLFGITFFTMFLDSLLNSLSGKNIRPNKFTIGMRELILAAREEAELNQRELAEKIYRRQAALSDMENGKMEPDASTILLMAHALQKPISYFFPYPWKTTIEFTGLSEKEEDLLIQAKRLSPDDLIRLIAQAKALASLTGKTR